MKRRTPYRANPEIEQEGCPILFPPPGCTGNGWIQAAPIKELFKALERDIPEEFRPRLM